ncbi:MAG: C39 family peptidase [Candidatus Curtissbacteria bacterium]|nr:C39 family peptidase [Candidatus Curtissbacteria bacterium]
MFKLVFIIVFLIIVTIGSLAAFDRWSDNTSTDNLSQEQRQLTGPSPSPKLTLENPPAQKILANDYHVFQTFNNCGPAALSMALSYYGINVSQQTLGQELRPYQNPQGDNDDKSVTLEELGEKSKDYELIPYHRPTGSMEEVKLFITYDIPVIARTLLKVDDDIGHYRIIKGYDETTGQIIQDDSLQGKNLRYSYSDFNAVWKKFNYEYLVLVPPEKEHIAKAILGENSDEQVAWRKAAELSQNELVNNPSDIYSRFNLSVALYNTGDYQESVREFEEVENQLPFRTLWYQIEPIRAYYELGNYPRVFAITDKVLNNHNRAFSELYLIRGEIYKKQGNLELARQEFEKAVIYNRNLQEAQEALNSL